MSGSIVRILGPNLRSRLTFWTGYMPRRRPHYAQANSGCYPCSNHRWLRRCSRRPVGRSHIAKVTSRIIRMDMHRLMAVSILAAGAMTTTGTAGTVVVPTMGIGATLAEDGMDMVAEIGPAVATAVPDMAVVTAAATVDNGHT